MIEVTYTLNGQTKSFRVAADRFDELIAWANKEFGNGVDIGGPDLPRNEPLARVRRKKS